MKGMIAFSFLFIGLFLTAASTRSCAPCETNADCQETEYCAKGKGTCDVTGMCLSRPDACTDEWAPVCGCDGQTYSNACEAAAAGTSVNYDGECEPQMCHTHEDCDAAAYCMLDACAAETGICETRPEICTEEYAPVCGCDGVTYGNACHAAQEGMNIDYEGECRPGPEYCFGNDDCTPDEEYCYFEVCALETGICAPRPQACTQEYNPVCGCDGVTYGNACSAAAAGMSVDYEGECNDAPERCWSHTECNEGEYCYFDICLMETGTCQSRPEMCPLLYDPVCGCDGTTYENACVAAMRGMSVDHAGACREQANQAIR